MERDFHIRNMVCDRCIKVLREELADAELKPLEIELGRVRLDLDEDRDKSKLVGILDQNGFELIEDPGRQLAEQVKIELIKLLQTLPLNLRQKLSVYLANKLRTDYSKVSKIFSSNEHVTIEKYFIKLKIEKVKELIQTGERNFTEISQMLDYSHVNHLSRQFKNETGTSLSEYRLQQDDFRTSLDRIV